MPPDNRGKRQMIQKYQEYYRGNRKEVATIQEHSDTYRRADAIRWYTRQSFVYKLINKALRTEDIEQLHIFRFFITDLCSSLAQEYKKMREREKGVLPVYRGVKLSNEEVEKLKENEGKLISMNGFLSTSRLSSVALNFASKSMKRRDAVVVLFETEYDFNGLNGDDIVCADVAKFSDYPEEQEVLFDLGATFKIQSVIREKLDLSRVNLRVTSEEADIAREYIKLNRKELEERSAAAMFGSLLCDMGQYDQSIKQFENIFQNHQGENISHIEFNLGRAHDFRGEYDKALQLSEHNYATMMMSKPVPEKASARVLSNIGNMEEKCLPSDHPDTASSLNNIGLVYDNKGEYDRALDYYLKCLKIQEECLPCHHPHTETSLNNIGLVYGRKGEYDHSLDYYSKRLKMREKCLPSDHPHIATSLGSIGNIYDRKGEYDRALRCDTKCIKNQEKCLPSDHPHIARSLGSIGNTYDKKGQYDRALEYYLKCLKIEEKCLPSDHPDIARSLLAIGNVYTGNGQYNRALDYYSKCLRMREKCLPSDHPHIATSLNNIGLVYGRKGEYDRALECYSKCLKRREKCLPSDHPYIARKRCLPSDHPDIATSLNIIGLVYGRKGEYDRALDYYSKCLKINGQYDRALDCYSKCLKMREKFLPSDHPHIATSLKNIGLVYDNKGEYDRAVDYYPKCLKMKEKCLASDHPDIASSLLAIGNVYYSKGEYDRASDYYSKWLRMKEKCLASDHPIIACSLSNIGNVYYRRREYKRAVGCFLKDA
ncbi:unnamed protein product [Didymodactylos carnosus]|uniref:Kinesin light chain n=1 Tax=Didymodactylos carnosus TaxID=1234261 RepID=A0A815D9R4_9BILA|nr:unnamed protein product [Didymodactylos carnosus]CAF4107750.1 unnamed protein product [Didymodactylos carnosus]